MVKCDIGSAYNDDWTVNCKEKNLGTTECEKSTVRSNVGTTLCNNERIKFENKKNRVSLNVTKIESDAMLVLLNVIVEPLNVRKK